MGVEHMSFNTLVKGRELTTGTDAVRVGPDACPFRSLRCPLDRFAVRWVTLSNVSTGSGFVEKYIEEQEYNAIIALNLRALKVCEGWYDYLMSRRDSLDTDEFRKRNARK